MDIFYLRTKGLAGQFLLAFQPLMQVTNMLFTHIAFSSPRRADTVYVSLKTTEQKYFH